MKQVILGTAGHIDHGKTTLIKTLTGVDLDRLKEEKERGITIQLGFTSLALPGGQRIGIVDVPGHEKFIRNMVAGVGGIDFVLFAIAADEGIMPQTREHLDICKILRTRRGIIALTKTDLVDEEWLELVQEEIRTFSRGSFLEHAPIIPVSSVTGEGIPALLAAMDRIVREVEDKPAAGILRLPIDRVFTMKGFGTVITGTLLSGSVAVGDSVEILPGGYEAKVRGIQVHNQQVPRATAGLRTAINLQGVEKESVAKGGMLIHPRTLAPTARIDVRLEHLPSSAKPLKNRAIARFHSGTSEVLCRIILLDQDELAPGAGSLAQIILEEPVVVLPHDRFVMRSYSPVYTIGGGEILDAHPHKHKRLAEETVAPLDAMQHSSVQEQTLLFIADAGFAGLDLRRLTARTGKDPAQLTGILGALIGEKKLVLIDRESSKVLSAGHYEMLQSLMLDEVNDYHKKFPLKTGMLKEELKSKLPQLVDARLFQHLLNDLLSAGRLIVDKDTLWLQEHKPQLKDSQKELKDKIAALYRRNSLTPPTIKELVDQMGGSERETQAIVALLTADGQLVKVKENLWFHREAIEELTRTLVETIKKTGEITPTQFKDLIQASRKFAIPLLEYFDQSKITIRVGDKRVLRDKKG
jgi:selenocysteine-specific elongation factor